MLEADDNPPPDLVRHERLQATAPRFVRELLHVFVAALVTSGGKR
jgi:hypothetical protein